MFKNIQRDTCSYVKGYNWGCRFDSSRFRAEKPWLARSFEFRFDRAGNPSYNYLGHLKFKYLFYPNTSTTFGENTQRIRKSQI